MKTTNQFTAVDQQCQISDIRYQISDINYFLRDNFSYFNSDKTFITL